MSRHEKIKESIDFIGDLLNFIRYLFNNRA